MNRYNPYRGPIRDPNNIPHSSVVAERIISELNKELENPRRDHCYIYDLAHYCDIPYNNEYMNLFRECLKLLIEMGWVLHEIPDIGPPPCLYRLNPEKKGQKLYDEGN